MIRPRSLLFQVVRFAATFPAYGAHLVAGWPLDIETDWSNCV